MTAAVAVARGARRAVRARLARPKREPVIVLGKEKSGTTVIAALLAEHIGGSVTLDIPALFGTRIGPIWRGERSLGDVVRQNRLEFSSDVIKQPTLTYLYPKVREAFPRARFLMIVRDPRENIRSVLNRLELPGDLPDLGPAELESLPEDWRHHFDRPGILNLPGDSYIASMAERWNFAVSVYLDHRDEMVLVRYEDFLADKAGSVARTAEALGLRSRRDVSHMVDRQYQRRGMRGVRWLDFYGERNLRLIERTCARRMRELGYESAI